MQPRNAALRRALRRQHHLPGRPGAVRTGRRSIVSVPRRPRSELPHLHAGPRSKQLPQLSEWVLRPRWQLPRAVPWQPRTGSAPVAFWAAVPVGGTDGKPNEGAFREPNTSPHGEPDGCSHGQSDRSDRHPDRKTHAHANHLGPNFSTDRGTHNLCICRRADFSRRRAAGLRQRGDWHHPWRQPAIWIAYTRAVLFPHYQQRYHVAHPHLQPTFHFRHCHQRLRCRCVDLGQHSPPPRERRPGFRRNVCLSRLPFHERARAAVLHRGHSVTWQLPHRYRGL